MAEEEQNENRDSIEEVFIERPEKAFTKNEITRTNYFNIKTAKSRQEKIDELYGFIQEELSDLVISTEIHQLLKKYKWYSLNSGGQRTKTYLETQQLRTLQEIMRHLWKLKEFEPSNVEESVIVEGVDGRPEGFARYAKDFDLERAVIQAKREREEAKKKKGGEDNGIGGEEKKKD